jgi:hypothetical protein
MNQKRADTAFPILLFSPASLAAIQALAGKPGQKRKHSAENRFRGQGSGI